MNFNDVMAKLKQVEAKAEELAARQAWLTEELHRREELLDQVIAALDALDGEPPDQVKH